MDKKYKLAKSFDLATACIAVLVAFGVQIILQFVFSLFSLSAKALTWTVVISNQVTFFVIAMAFCFGKKVDPLAITGAKEPPKWYHFPLFILIAITCVTCFAPMSGLFTRMLCKLGYEHMPQYFIPRDNAGLFTLAFLALTILPVLGEEVILRGVLMSGAKRRSPLFAILFPAMIFALLHGNLHQLIHQFLLGAVMGYLVYLTGSIYASATIHITNNAIAMLLDYGFMHNFINKNFYYYIAGEAIATTTLIGIALSFFALVMLLVLVTCLIHRDRSRVKEYDPIDGGVGERITSYLIYLSTPTAEKEGEVRAEQEGKKPMSADTVLIVVILSLVLAATVFLTLIPGVK